ncbi:hypothetical protein ALT785_270087 [Alteromonas infernus]
MFQLRMSGIAKITAQRTFALEHASGTRVNDEAVCPLNTNGVCNYRAGC